MRKTLLCIIGFFCCILFSGISFGAAVCPGIPKMIDLDAESAKLSKQAISNIRTCLEARAGRKESSITEFTCPSGDFNLSNRPHTDEILAYQLAVATVFKAIDTSAMQYAQNLQCNRDTDPIKWQQSIKVFTNANTGYASKYYAACSISYVLSLLNIKSQPPIIKTTDTFPQADCMMLAQAKVKALHNLGLLLASNGIGKGFQNGKDELLDKTKTQYSNLLDKVSNYLRTVGRAVAKITKYIRNPI